MLNIHIILHIKQMSWHFIGFMDLTKIAHICIYVYDKQYHICYMSYGFRPFTILIIVRSVVMTNYRDISDLGTDSNLK